MSTPDAATVDITTAADAGRLVDLALRSGAEHMLELLRPAMRGELNVIFTPRHCRMPPLHRLGKQGRPLIVILGDDDYSTSGPAGFAAANKLRQWAAHALVHGCGAEPWHYAAAADLAREHRRLLLVETSSAATDAWGIFLHQRRDLPISAVLIRPGDVHPAPIRREEVH